MSEKIIWNGSEPITIGEADKDGKPVKVLVLNPGDEIPPEWIEKMKASPGGVDMIGQDDPLDMGGVEEFYRKRKEGSH